MSIRVISLVWDNYTGGGSSLLALLALADWSDDKGLCWPSMSAIAKRCRLSRSQALRVVHDLINRGFVRVVGNEHGGPPGATRRYQIVLNKLTGSAHATGSVDATGSTHATRRVAPMHKTGSAHATQTVIEPSRTVTATPNPLFERFWSVWPKKVAKADAQKAWAKLRVDDDVLSKILAAVEITKASKDWKKDDGQFIPYPATWLNGRRWEDANLSTNGNTENIFEGAK